MGSIHNDVFRIVNLRGSAELVVEPDMDEGIGDGGEHPAVEMIRSGAIALGTGEAQPLEELLESNAGLVESAKSSDLARLARDLRQKPELAERPTLNWGDAKVPVGSIAKSASFKEAYAETLNAWLLLKYSGTEDLDSLE